MNVFFVSNSTCYYFTDELYGLLKAAGYGEAKLALAYCDGQSLERHYESYRGGRKEYQYRVIDGDGLHTEENVSLKEALAKENWDVISFDNPARAFSSGDTATSIQNAEPYFHLLLEDLQKKFPEARFLWHQVWANEIGYNMAFRMESREQRDQVYRAKKGTMEHMSATYGIGGVPTGDAWEKVRDLPLFTTPLPVFPEVERFTLCSRIVGGAFKDDFSHDGDIGGGQYLNACVWFEVLTGESCLENSYRPAYRYQGQDVSLSEEKIQILKQAAHDAVAENKA